MPLDPIVEDINEVDESVRGFYKETDNGFMLDVQPKNGFALENVEGLKSALGKERATASELKSKMNKYSALGDTDPSELLSELESLRSLKDLDPNKEADKIAQSKIDSVQKQLVSKHTKELEQIQGSASKYKSQLQKVLIDDAAKSAIIAAGGDERTVAYMLDTVKKQLTLSETENGFMTQVVDQNGHPVIGDSNGNPQTLKGLVEAMKQDELWMGAFPGRSKSGSGRSSDSAGAGKPASGLKRSDMTSSEKSAYIRQHGREAYLKLKN
ncbi:MAG: hypothetical protein Unbinned8472contig1000_13 [Prokaryotic dsDNA virus sp.]|nr:MAG: hypothetical protein Unbinned8472contig1000_13 [Prokaryotic dsDNA virus sp.]|tara:strand:+ start:11794 stop:12600 length:807 start_codon:yes stop_codon:yes gene_type:complete